MQLLVWPGSLHDFQFFQLSEETAHRPAAGFRDGTNLRKVWACAVIVLHNCVVAKMFSCGSLLRFAHAGAFAGNITVK